MLFRSFKDHLGRSWPLSFVAQIDFAEIISAGGLEGFPSSGRLLFFCDPIETWGMTGASVMFIIEPTHRLGRRDFPVEFSDPAPSTGGAKVLHVQAAPRDPQAVAAAATVALP